MKYSIVVLLVAVWISACASEEQNCSFAGYPERPDDMPPTAYLLFIDRSASADTDTAYTYSIPSINRYLESRVKPGDPLKVYAIQSNTVSNPPLYNEEAPALMLSGTKLAEYQTAGGKTRERMCTEQLSAFAKTRTLAVGTLNRTARAQLDATKRWTDVYGAFTLARNAQLDGAAEVHLLVQSDMIHSTPDFELSEDYLTSPEQATELGRVDAAKLGATQSVSGLDWPALHLTVYLPKRYSYTSGYRSLIRPYWRAFGEAVGMGEVRFVE